MKGQTAVEIAEPELKEAEKREHAAYGDAEPAE